MVSESTHAALPAGAQDVKSAPGRWRPAPLVKLALVVHVLALAWIAFEPRDWMWAVGAMVLSHVVLSLTVLLTRSSLIGANLTRLPAAAAARNEVTLTFDDGPNPEITPRVLDLLDAYGMRASFFCIAEHALAWPDLTREIMRRGHQIENHSFDHRPTFSLYSYGRLAREVDASQSAFGQVIERTPRFFRAPAGFRNPLLDPVLARRGLRYVSWTRRGFDTVTRDAARVLKRLSRNLAAGDILLLHDGSGAHTAAGVPVVLEVLPQLLEQLRARGLKSVPLGAAFADVPLEEKRAS